MNFIPLILYIKLNIKEPVEKWLVFSFNNETTENRFLNAFLLIGTVFPFASKGQ